MAFPQIAVALNAAKRVRNFDCTVFKDELLRPDGSIPPGEVVEVVDPRGAFLAMAFYHPQARVALRIVSTSAGEPVDRPFLGARLRQAISARDRIAGTNAKRLVFSEADGLPGLVLDAYADYLVLQIRSAGMERLRPVLLELIQELRPSAGILERSDKEFRNEEGLEPVSQCAAGTVPDRIQIEEEGLKFWVDPHQGLKTGFYLDQRTTRQRLRALVRSGEQFLDAFSYTGALGIAAASRGAHVVCLEQQEPLLELAKENARLNGVADRVEYVAGDAFYWLAAKAQTETRFDWVSLDPPSLAKAKHEVTKGRQALHHLLVQGLGLLEPGGRLLLSLCTYHLLGLTEEIVRIAAAERSARLAVVDQWNQPADHPWILQIPATHYLTTWLFERGARSGA